MYQFYYAGEAVQRPHQACKLNMADYFRVAAIRPAMWEEHCLECSAPACFESCVHYVPRSDGRCKRFENGITVFADEKGCCGQAARVRFRKWANMMTIIFPAMLPVANYAALTQKNQQLGKRLKTLASSKLPQSLRWQGIRTVEFLRRRSLRKTETENTVPDAFVFHGYSHETEPFRLILEVFDSHTSVFKTSVELTPGENLHILKRADLNPACWQPNFLVKIYPENDREAVLDILWCDFVQGEFVAAEQPAPTVKCVVWDLDNTLWDGTLIETENPGQLRVKPGVVETIRALDERGIIQSIASKNDFASAWAVVEGLGLEEYFLYPQIHWNAKSGSLEQIARSLNVGVDSFALVDDSAFERNQVQSALPQVRVYDPEGLASLLDRPEFQVPITLESKNRRSMYRAEEKRHALQQSENDDTVAFLRKCHLSLTVFEPKTETEQTRCYELVARTNQLNMSGKKYTPEEFTEVLKRENHRNVAFSCRDDFGAYGIVGFAQYRVEGDCLHFAEFAMSCRVAGKYVESAFFAYLLQSEDCTEGCFPVVKTKKNTLLRNTLASIGFSAKEESDVLVKYRFTDTLANKEIVKIGEE